MGVYSLSGTVETISTPFLENKLILAGPSNISVSVVVAYGTTHLLIKAKTATFAYCLESRFWYEWSGTASVWDRTSAVVAGANVLVYSLSTTATGGKTYILSPSNRTFQDDGSAFTATAIVGPIDADVNERKAWRSLSLIADQESTGTVTVSWSNDDFKSFNTSEARSISLTSGNGRIYRLGNGRQRIFRFDHSDNAPLRVRAVEIDFDVGVT